MGNKDMLSPLQFRNFGINRRSWTWYYFRHPYYSLYRVIRSRKSMTPHWTGYPPDWTSFDQHFIA
jgi:hypothetical protein